MSHLDDAALRDRLERRVESSTLNAEQRDQILTAVAAGRPASSRGTMQGPGGRWVGYAAAALGLVLVVAVVLKPAVDQGPPAASPPPGSAIASSPRTSEPGVSPTAPTAPAPTMIAGPPEVLSTEQLAAAVTSREARGQIVLADVSVAPMPMPSTGEPCPVAVACQVGEIAGIDFEVSVMVGWRQASDGEGTFSEIEKRWLVRLGMPRAEQHIVAFRVGDHLVEYLGPVVETGGGQLVWDVSTVKAGEHADPASDLYAVEGWLVKTSPAPCPPPRDYGQNTDTSYWCGGSFVTQALTRPSSTVHVLDPGGLHVQWNAYDQFAETPEEGPQGSEPRFGRYLVRSVGCPPAVMGDCPVWSMVGRLDDFSPPAAIGDLPAEIAGERVLTTHEALAHAGNPKSAEPFLVGGWVSGVDVDCAIDPDLPVTPLLEQCDGGYRITDDPSDAWGQFRLVVEGSRIPVHEPVVLRVHANDPRAAECPGNYRRNCETAIVVDEVVWTAPSGPTDPPPPTPSEPAATLPPTSNAILTADQIARLAMDPGPEGRVLVARATVDLSTPQPADVRCVEPLCSIGLIHTSAGTVPVFVHSGAMIPNSSEIQAFRLLGDAVEYVGPVALPTGQSDLSWSVPQMTSGAAPLPATLLYAVEGWLVEPVNGHECPELPNPDEDDEYPYWCGTPWLTEERVYLDPRTWDPEAIVPGALHVQRWAYQTFGVGNNVDGPRGAEPRHDTYLLAQAACPEVRIGECPVWEIVASLDSEAAPGSDARADCLNYTVSIDRGPISAQQLAQFTDTIVIGTVSSVGPGFWNSPDGRKPRFRPMSETGLVTAVEITGDTTLRGSMAAAAVVSGGTYGCDAGTYYPNVELTEGSRYVLFLSDATWSRPGPATPTVMEAWRVLSDGRVVDTHSGTVLLTLEELGPYLFGPEISPVPSF